MAITLDQITWGRTEEQIEASKTSKGGFSIESYLALGFSEEQLPAPKGWRKKLVANQKSKQKPRQSVGAKQKEEKYTGGSGTSDYYKNQRLVLSGETFASGAKKKGAEPSPSKKRSRF